MVPRLLSLGLAFLAINCGEVIFADQPTSAVFFRGVNLFGPSLMIDGHFWHAGDSPDLVCNGQSFENQSVTLHPSTDSERARMIRSSRWGRAIDVDMMRIPAGDYQIFVYVWEDNDPTTYSIFVNGRKVVGPFTSGAAGSWKRLGPWPVRPNEGCSRISAQGGDANLCEIEIWSGTGPVPDPLAPEFNLALSAEQLAFFESKIRPTLIEKCYRCHSQDAQEVGGNLLLDSHAAIVKGGDTGPPIALGDPDASLLNWRLPSVGINDISLTVKATRNWDQHSNMSLHADHAKVIDRPIAGLSRDLKQRGMLDETLVVWTTEFGWTPGVDGKDGRGHHSACFSSFMPRFCTCWASITLD